MISDTLFDAVDDIRRYLDDPVFAKVYSGALRQQIEATLATMEATRIRLDTPPPAPKSVGASEASETIPVTGQPIETAHEALINLIRQADGVWIATPGEIQLQKGGQPFANIKVPFADDWNGFAEDLGFRGLAEGSN